MNDTLENLLNSEGRILSIRSYEDKIYLKGLVSPFNSQVSVETTPFTISLYLRGRINLNTLFLLSIDKEFYFQSGSKKQTIFFDKRNHPIPKELSKISCGDQLYPLLSQSMRPEGSYAQILEMLPDRPEFESIKLNEVEITQSGLSVINPDFEDQISLVNIEAVGLDYQDSLYISCQLKDTPNKVYTRVNDTSLKLFLTGVITLKELFLLRTTFIIQAGEKYALSCFNDTLPLIEELDFGNCTYFTLPIEMQLDEQLEAIRLFQLFESTGR